ncbi:P1 family peptidase [Kurthia sibirica]|uniref:Aminopeptidase n=1 Tax=Kurthia sibirica TaxID=202750 RepID=A0A2U3AK78_9BACL|nr:P1 family peptidase [Kurthia sibirica]PWI24923.1 aminopeptidase [Kurthia sibirica]GEK33167.1 aminopeptidase [Kurthia sibirica]
MRKGIHNQLIDVPGIKLGHQTLYKKLNDADTICTGVTAILPHGGNLFLNKIPAASFVLNGFGKSVGLVQIAELGVLESPIMLTNTFSVSAVLDGTMTYMLDQNPTIGDTTSSLNIVVGECNDSYLNSMRLRAIQPSDALAALHHATSSPFEQGAVGAGKGMICYEQKGGIGSSSRIVEMADQPFVVGVLALTNFGNAGECKMASWSDKDIDKPDGSVIIIVATDAPLSDRQLQRLAKRAAIGLGRTGTHIHNGSGDIILAFSTGYTIPHNQDDPLSTPQRFVRDDSKLMNFLFTATVEATEEAVYQSLIHAETTIGRQGRQIDKALF